MIRVFCVSGEWCFVVQFYQTNMRKIFILYCLFQHTLLHCQVLKTPIAARYIGLGAYSKNFTDVFSFTSNQAALAEATSMEAGIYTERKFLLNAATLYAAVFIAHTQKGNIGISATYFGFAKYNESEVGFAFARSLGKINLGIKFNYYSIRIGGYGNASALNIELGAITRLSQKVFAGFELYNPAGGNLSKTNEKLRSAYKFGVGYEASDKFFVGTEIVKEEDVPINVDVGFQYSFMKQFFVRAGIASETTNTYIGVGFVKHILRVDFTVGYHPQLGYSPGLMLIIKFGNEKV